MSNDEIFNSFDAATRADQQQVLAALDQATKGRATDVQSIIPQLQQVVANLSPVAQVYEKDQQQTDDIFVQLNTIMQALADEHQQLAGFLANGNVALGAVAAEGRCAGGHAPGGEQRRQRAQRGDDAGDRGAAHRA